MADYTPETPNPDWDCPVDALTLGRLHSIAQGHIKGNRYVATERIYRSHKALEEQLAAARQSLEAAECPDAKTAHALADMIARNDVPSPWRDAGLRLYAFGRWLAALKEKHDG